MLAAYTRTAVDDLTDRRSPGREAYARYSEAVLPMVAALGGGIELFGRGAGRQRPRLVRPVGAPR